VQDAKHAAIEARLDRAAESCLRRGATLTELRRHVLMLILNSERPPTAYQLLDRLKAVRSGAAPQTIYRALDFLLEQGLILKVERLSAFIPHMRAGWGPCRAQLLICRSCGAVLVTEDGEIARALEQAAEREGFTVTAATVELEGTCTACAHARSACG
jgi:Fur family transcriptional regulator, zinc uptake regulator